MKKFFLASSALVAIWTGVATASTVMDHATARLSATQAAPVQLAEDDHGAVSGRDDEDGDDGDESLGVSGCDSTQDKAEKAECKG